MAQQQVIERKTRQEWAAVINADWRKSIESIIQTGRDLNAAKEDLPNGQFGEMIANDLDFSQSVAEQLMAIARHPQIGKSDCSQNLPASWTTLYQLSRLKEKDFRWAQRRGLISQTTSKGGAIALRKAREDGDDGEPVFADTAQRNLPSPAEAKSIAPNPPHTCRTREMAEIWRVKVSDGTVHYFTNRPEADFFYKDTAEAGFSVQLAPIPMPETVRDFVIFMEGQEEDRRHTETLLAQIEKVTPNWRAYRSLAEAVEVAIHHAKQTA